MKKIALIIGNSNYHSCPKLENPINDAKDINKKFSELGIKTLLHTDLDQQSFDRAIYEYFDDLGSYEVAIFFFAGHGMQIDGENYLCAVDTKPENDVDAKHSSISLNFILDKLQKSKIYTKILILDACRDNPFERTSRSTYKRGLAPIDAPLGTFIAFATSPGEYASDGSGRNNGAFTEAFLKHLGQNDLKIEELFKRTRNTLYSLTNQKQISWEHTSLMGDFYFATSHLTGEFTTNYESNALIDKNFELYSDKKIIKIIRSLKSHDWYIQNPAINRITPTVLEEGNKNEIFVLGRNIYQAADGGARDAESYIRNLKSNLDLFSDEIRFNLLNGIIYEIYFNSDGKLRGIFKISCLDDVIPLLKEKKDSGSGLFLKNKLDEFDFRVIYDVTGNKNFVFDITTEYVEDEEIYIVKEILKESKNILYNRDGSEEYKFRSFGSKISRENIQKRIADDIGAPVSSIQCIFDLPDDIDKIKFPYSGGYSLLNYQLK